MTKIQPEKVLDTGGESVSAVINPPLNTEFTTVTISAPELAEQMPALAPGDIIASNETPHITKTRRYRGNGRIVPDMPEDAIVEVPGLGLFNNGTRRHVDAPVGAEGEDE
jgi:hypothetical protein